MRKGPFSIEKYKEDIKDAYNGYFENQSAIDKAWYKWEDLDAKKYRKIFKSKAHSLEVLFDRDFWDLIILVSPNPHVFSAVVRALNREKVYSRQRFVVFYISKFVGGIKEYVHVKGVGEKTEKVLSQLFVEITGEDRTYENLEF